MPVPVNLSQKKEKKTQNTSKIIRKKNKNILNELNNEVSDKISNNNYDHMKAKDEKRGQNENQKQNNLLNNNNDSEPNDLLYTQNVSSTLEYDNELKKRKETNSSKISTNSMPSESKNKPQPKTSPNTPTTSVHSHSLLSDGLSSRKTTTYQTTYSKNTTLQFNSKASNRRKTCNNRVPYTILSILFITFVLILIDYPSLHCNHLSIALLPDRETEPFQSSFLQSLVVEVASLTPIYYCLTTPHLDQHPYSYYPLIYTPTIYSIKSTIFSCIPSISDLVDNFSADLFTTLTHSPSQAKYKINNVTKLNLINTHLTHRTVSQYIKERGKEKGHFSTNYPLTISDLHKHTNVDISMTKTAYQTPLLNAISNYPVVLTSMSVYNPAPLQSPLPRYQLYMTHSADGIQASRHLPSLPHKLPHPPRTYAIFDWVKYSYRFAVSCFKNYWHDSPTRTHPSDWLDIFLFSRRRLSQLKSHMSLSSLVGVDVSGISTSTSTITTTKTPEHGMDIEDSHLINTLNEKDTVILKSIGAFTSSITSFHPAVNVKLLLQPSQIYNVMLYLCRDLPTSHQQTKNRHVNKSANLTFCTDAMVRFLVDFDYSTSTPQNPGVSISSQKKTKLNTSELISRYTQFLYHRLLDNHKTTVNIVLPYNLDIPTLVRLTTLRNSFKTDTLNSSDSLEVAVKLFNDALTSLDIVPSYQSPHPQSVNQLTNLSYSQTNTEEMRAFHHLMDPDNSPTCLAHNAIYFFFPTGTSNLSSDVKESFKDILLENYNEETSWVSPLIYRISKVGNIYIEDKK